MIFVLNKLPYKYIRALQFLFARPDVENINSDELMLFNTLPNGGNFCYQLATYYLFLNIKKVRSMWERVLKTSKEEIFAHAKIYSICKSISLFSDFEGDMSTWKFFDTIHKAGTEQKSLFDFLVMLFDSKLSYGIDELFKWKFTNKEGLKEKDIAAPYYNFLFAYEDDMEN